MNLNVGDWVICFYGWAQKTNPFYSVFLIKVTELKFDALIGDYYSFGSFLGIRSNYPQKIGPYIRGLFPSKECIRLIPLHQQYAEITQTIPLKEIYKYERIQRRRVRKNSK